MAYSGEGNLIEGEIEGDPNKTVRPIVCDADGHLIIDLDASTITIGTVQIEDTSGNILTSVGGSLNVNITGGTINTVPFGVSPLAVGTITSVPDNTLTTIVTYTAVSAVRLSRISVSGTVYSKFQLFFNTVLIETKRSGPERSLDFIFDLPLSLAPTDILDVKVTHYNPAILADFESTVYGN